jgi:hypothetical protein
VPAGAEQSGQSAIEIGRDGGEGPTAPAMNMRNSRTSVQMTVAMPPMSVQATATTVMRMMAQASGPPPQ